MKIIQINENLKINIEQIYSLEYSDNKNDIIQWKNKYDKYLDQFTKDPITLQISDNKIFKPDFSKENNKEDLKLYSKALNEHILTIIGICPELNKKYSIILSTGLKVNVSQDIYDKINEVFNKYLI